MLLEQTATYDITLLYKTVLLKLVNSNFISHLGTVVGHAVAQLVEALRYKPESRGSIPDGVTGIFHWQGRTMALGLTQPLT